MHYGAVRRVLQDVSFANLIRQVRPGPVGREAGKNSDRAGSQGHGLSIRWPRIQTLKTQVRPLMRKCSPPMQARCDPRAAVLSCRIGKRHPASQILLRRHEGIAIVLMPREFLCRTRAFVDQLIPHSRALNQSNPDTMQQNRMFCELFRHRGLQHSVRPKDYFIRSRNAGLIAWHLRQIGVGCCFHRIESFNEAVDFSLSESVLQYKTALLPVRIGLLCGDLLIGWLGLNPSKIPVQRV